MAYKNGKKAIISNDLNEFQSHVRAISAEKNVGIAFMQNGQKAVVDGCLYVHFYDSEDVPSPNEFNEIVDVSEMTQS